jgi:rRNA maturation RNase YbeY
MITIRNTQRKIPINTATLQKTAHRILNLLGYTDFDLGIWLTTNKTIRTYNRNYRHKDKPTDILSFPFYPKLKVGQHIKAQSSDERNLGDLIISLEYAQRDANKQNIPFSQQMKVLLVHGICHLLGYDHINDKDYVIMHKREQELLKRLENKPTTSIT